jgi:hypothetical protein
LQINLQITEFFKLATIKSKEGVQNG